MMQYRKNNQTPEMREIIGRCEKSTDLQYQKDVSYLLMLLRQSEWQLQRVLKTR